MFQAIDNHQLYHECHFCDLSILFLSIHAVIKIYILLFLVQGYIVLNRPWAFVQWLEKADIQEE